MDVLSVVLIALVGSGLFGAGVYWVGLLFSRGFHRGKRESLHKLVQDCSTTKEGN